MDQYEEPFPTHKQKLKLALVCNKTVQHVRALTLSIFGDFDRHTNLNYFFGIRRHRVKQKIQEQRIQWAVGLVEPLLKTEGSWHLASHANKLSYRHSHNYFPVYLDQECTRWCEVSKWIVHCEKRTPYLYLSHKERINWFILSAYTTRFLSSSHTWLGENKLSHDPSALLLLLIQYSFPTQKFKG